MLGSNLEVASICSLQKMEQVLVRTCSHLGGNIVLGSKIFTGSMKRSQLTISGYKNAQIVTTIDFKSFWFWGSVRLCRGLELVEYIYETNLLEWPTDCSPASPAMAVSQWKSKSQEQEAAWVS